MTTINGIDERALEERRRRHDVVVAYYLYVIGAMDYIADENALDPGIVGGVDDENLDPGMVMDPGIVGGADDENLDPGMVMDPGIVGGADDENVDPGMAIDPGIVGGAGDENPNLDTFGPDDQEPPRSDGDDTGDGLWAGEGTITDDGGHDGEEGSAEGAEADDSVSVKQFEFPGDNEANIDKSGDGEEVTSDNQSVAPGYGNDTTAMWDDQFGGQSEDDDGDSD